MDKPGSWTVNTVTVNSVFRLRASSSIIFSHAATKQVSNGFVSDLDWKRSDYGDNFLSAGTSTVNYKMFRDPAVQKGKPLPDKGTCKHYKQSHRWLRYNFSFCGCNYHLQLQGAVLCGKRYLKMRKKNSFLTHLPRFPCCGRAYACDACHDEDQDHPMELATRMLCGYCAKEQVGVELWLVLVLIDAIVN